MPRISPATVLLAGLAACGPAQAVTYCVTDSAGLVSVLDTARLNGQHDHIRVAVGTYPAPVGGFVFNTAFGSDDMDLAITGGWSGFSGSPCVVQLPEHVHGTVLDGNGLDRVLFVALNGASSFELARLVIHDGHADQRGGMHLAMAAGATGEARIEGVLFLANTAETKTGALGVIGNATHGGVTVANNVFMHNSAGCQFGAAKIEQPDGADLFFLNNTVIYNTHGQACESAGVGGIDFYGFSGNDRIAIVNNLFWGNDGADLLVRGDPGSTSARVQYNNFTVAALESISVASDNLSLDPLLVWDDSGMTSIPTHRPGRGSPMIDAGEPPPSVWPGLLDALDYDGNERVNGSAIDIGAVEDQTLFADGFDG